MTDRKKTIIIRVVLIGNNNNHPFLFCKVTVLEISYYDFLMPINISNSDICANCRILCPSQFCYPFTPSVALSHCKCRKNKKKMDVSTTKIRLDTSVSMTLNTGLRDIFEAWPFVKVCIFWEFVGTILGRGHTPNLNLMLGMFFCQ